ncbi:cysteine desulfurase [Paenibacillus barcinonensis]|uniref:Cysteine desulfurase n=1 Tax=Paenibacillus barcinonensis TaxID=198119 RepID=A0A2V4VMB8_PAEBA|nr:cysteine desulfurase family protein [Paenibacillus barcinonensis]PYE47422.1 cysteine desulfurase [Paenibacillus barcinonensis]QKS56341.1 cysteine desulfurase [Paenibacillus barcinonensis]
MKYFDYAATTPPHPEVVRTITEIMEAQFGNASSIHGYGERADQLLRRARAGCAAAIGVKADEIIFTSGATESNNLAIKGAALRYASRGKHIITTAAEHASVYESVLQLQQWGWEVTFLPVDSEGRVTAEQVIEAVRSDTVLVSLMHVNNETGTVHPVQEIGQQLKQKAPRVLFHVDGVQGFGKLPVAPAQWKADLYSLSAHKVRGPKGTGLLYVRDGVELTSLLSGGSQEHGLRAGTENVAMIVGMAKAMRIAAESQPDFARRIRVIRDRMIDTIAVIPGLELNSTKEGAPHIVNFSYPGMKAEVALHTLEQLGCTVSTQSACSSRSAEPSRVLLAMGREAACAAGGLRISFGDEHTEEDAAMLEQALHQMVARLRPLERRM